VPLLLAAACAQTDDRPLVYPGATWATAADPARLGWSVEDLERVRDHARRIGSQAYLVVDRGWLVDSYGDPSAKVIVQSIRKSLLNALIGIEVSNGRIRIESTLEELGIDDVPALTRQERSATVADLLRSKSGVYHGSASSPDFMRAFLPQRESHTPGAYWYYNNWDFNALGTILERASGEDLFAKFRDSIAAVLQMEDFSTAECYDQLEPVSIHAAYHFSMSARDMARFGLLYLAGGRWDGRAVLDPEWIAQSTRPYSGNKNGGYGYLWWVDPRTGDYSARGGTGQLILVSPSEGLVVVHTVDRHAANAPLWADVFRLVDLVKAAKR